MKDHPVWQFSNQMPPGREFEIYHATNTTPQPTIYHSHSCYELYFIIRGSIRVIVEEMDVGPVLGETLTSPPLCMHRVTHTDPSQPYERFYVYLSREFLQSISTDEYDFISVLDRLAVDGRYCLKAGKEAVLSLLPMVDEIIRSSEDTSPAGVLANRCRMTLCLLQMLQMLEHGADSSSRNESSRMNELIRYINQNAAQPLTLDHLAQVFGISKYALLHKFKDYTGMSIHQYILTRRVILAQQFIRRGAKPQEACEQSGFTDYTSFYRAFKARTGKSPHQYIKTLTE